MIGENQENYIKAKDIVKRMMAIEDFLILTMDNSEDNPLHNFFEKYPNLYNSVKDISESIKSQLNVRLNNKNNRTNLDAYIDALLKMKETKGFSLMVFLCLWTPNFINTLSVYLPLIENINQIFNVWKELEDILNKNKALEVLDSSDDEYSDSSDDLSYSSSSDYSSDDSSDEIDIVDTQTQLTSVKPLCYMNSQTTETLSDLSRLSSSYSSFIEPYSNSTTPDPEFLLR